MLMVLSKNDVVTSLPVT